MCKNSIEDKIKALCKKHNAVILAHLYERADVQDIAHYTGDSLGLSRQAAQTDADVIVFCGVHFMAETAKILSPQKTVLLPDANAGCPMANMLTLKELNNFKAQYPDALTVAYVNCSAEIKAEVDICCTSSNAVKVIESLPADKDILFVPDKSLGAYVKQKTDRNVIPWSGFCPTHHRFRVRDIDEMRALHPDAMICSHPECTEDVLQKSDFVGSTSQIIDYCCNSPAKEFVIGSEIGMLHPLKLAAPDKNFYPLSELGDCPNMKLTTLEKVLWCLEDLSYEITLDEDIRQRAESAVKKMVQIG